MENNLTLKIITQKPEAVYEPGETIIGFIYVRIETGLEIESLILTAQGIAQINRDDGKARKRYINATDDYKSSELHLNSKFEIFPLQQSNRLYMEVGDYSYQFQIHLPSHLPTSFKHEDCFVEYTLTTTLCSLCGLRKETERNFIVISPLDLNQFPVLKQPVMINESKCLSWGSNNLGHVNASLFLPKTGFVSGECIQFYAKIENKSKKHIESVELNLTQYITYYAKKGFKCSTNKISNISYSNVITAKSTCEWSDSVLPIPYSYIPFNNLSSIIHVAYFVTLQIKQKRLSHSLQLDIPIAIGTIPFNN